MHCRRGDGRNLAGDAGAPQPRVLKAIDKAVADAQDVETDEDAGAALPPPDAIPVPSLK